DTGPDHHTVIDLILVARRFPAGVVERLLRCGHCEDDEIVDLPLLLGLHPSVRIEGIIRTVAARNLTGNLGRQVGDIEGLDAPRAAFPRDQAPPSRFYPAGERRHHSKSRDDHAPHRQLLARRQYHILPAPQVRPASSRPANRQDREIGDDQLFAFFSRNLMASPTVKMVSAASSGISQPNSSSNAMTSSTVSRLSAPRSSMKLAFSVTLSASTPRCSTTIFFTRSPMSLIAATSCPLNWARSVSAPEPLRYGLAWHPPSNHRVASGPL